MTSAGGYMLSAEKANGIITEVKTAMKSWRSEARSMGLRLPADLLEHRADD
ncbi:MAG: hypothetical protein ACI30K_03775 [Muribaculaceae bacterium]